MNPSVVDVVDDVDVVVDSSTSVELVEVEVELLLVVVVSSVVLVDDVVTDVLEVELVDELVAPGSVLLVVVGLVVVVVLVAETRVVDGRLVIVVAVAGYGSGQAVGAAALRAAKRPGASFFTLPPKSAQYRRVPLVSTTASAPCAGSSSVIPSRSARMLMPLPPGGRSSSPRNRPRRRPDW